MRFFKFLNEIRRVIPRRVFPRIHLRQALKFGVYYSIIFGRNRKITAHLKPEDLLVEHVPAGVKADDDKD